MFRCRDIKAQTTKMKLKAAFLKQKCAKNEVKPKGERKMSEMFFSSLLLSFVLSDLRLPALKKNENKKNLITCSLSLFLFLPSVERTKFICDVEKIDCESVAHYLKTRILCCVIKPWKSIECGQAVFGSAENFGPQNRFTESSRRKILQQVSAGNSQDIARRVWQHRGVCRLIWEADASVLLRCKGLWKGFCHAPVADVCFNSHHHYNRF